MVLFSLVVKGELILKKVIFALMFFVLILSACGNDLSERDQEACDLYESIVESAEKDEISDDEMLDELEEAWNIAESDDLQDLLDDLLIYFEDGQGNSSDIVKSIKLHCSID